MAIKLAVLASTRGTDLKGIIEAIDSGMLEATIEIVITNKDCGAIEIAKEHGVAHQIMPSSGIDREEYDKQLAAEIESQGAELILLIGYMRYLSPWFVNEYKNKIMNIHPSLLPAFAGGMDLNVHELALEHGVKVTGCTLHFVDEGKDTGPIIIQRAIPILESDTPETLKKKVQAEEVDALIDGIRLFSEERLEVQDGKVKILNL